jgi:hypothetical protein
MKRLILILKEILLASILSIVIIITSILSIVDILYQKYLLMQLKITLIVLSIIVSKV